MTQLPASYQVKRFCRQCLQLEREPQFPDPQLLKLPEVQEALYQNLFADGAVSFPPPARYQIRVLKELVARIENSIDNWDEQGVNDCLMEVLASLVAGPILSEMVSVQQKSYVTYSISEISEGMLESAETRSITLLESRSLLASAGTTGYRTWEACLHLGQYLLSEPSTIRGKRVLELGAGTGYLSVLCAKYLGAARVMASDGSDDVINHLPENFFLNNLQDRDNISVLDLKWGHALVGTEEDRWNGGEPVDVVLGADITYDTNGNASLVATLSELFDLNPQTSVIIAATERNSSTLESFLDRCRNAGIETSRSDFGLAPGSSQTGPFYETGVPIPIFKCSRP